jgi:TolB-like protein/DNA-binding winged helix-turn-helix (wHTH) protein/Flp pilus assembly protein TadD
MLEGMESSAKASVLCFGEFELETEIWELRKDGVSVKLGLQSVRLLALLARHQGHLVSREEIRREIWSPETFVNFAQGMNSSMRQIRAVLGDDAKKPRYVETLARRGYRFIQSVQAKTSLRPIQSVARPVCESRFVIHHGGVVTLGVLPFENLSGNARHECAADSITDILINELTRIDGLCMASRRSVMRFKGVRKPLSEIAKDLNVNLIVEGAVLFCGQQARVTAQLIDPRTEKNLWAQAFDTDFGEILKLQKLVAQAIGTEIRSRLKGQDRTRQGRIQTQVPGAYRAYVKGRYYWNKRTESGLIKGLECYEMAIHEDPSFALAYAGLADCCLILSQSGPLPPAEAYPRVRAAAEKAVELDGTLAEAHASLAYAKMTCDWNWHEAEIEFNEALLLNPKCAIAHQWYADYLTATGRHDKAVDEIKTAWELDPLSPIINSDVGWSLFYAREYDEAIKHYRNVLEMEPNFLPARWGLGMCYLAKSMFSQAIVELKGGVSVSGESPTMMAGLAQAYALAGSRSKSKKLLRELEDLSKRRYVPSFDMAAVYLSLGEADRAFACFQRAYTERGVYLVYLNADPRFTGERRDARLQSIVTQVGLPS